VVKLLGKAMGNVCCGTRDEEMESIQQRAAADGVEFFSEYAEPSASSEVKLEVEKFVEIDALKKEIETKLVGEKRKHPHKVENLYRLGLFLTIIREDFTRAKLELTNCERQYREQGTVSANLYLAMALLHWLLGKPKEERHDRAKVWCDKALEVYKDTDCDYGIWGDYALFCESDRTPGGVEEAILYYKKALKHPSKKTFPVLLCNYATCLYQTPPHCFDLAEKHFRDALRIVTHDKFWAKNHRGVFVQHSYNIFVAAYAIKITTTAVHGDIEWENTFRGILEESGINNVKEFFPFDISVRPLSLVVYEDFHLCSPLAEQPEEFALVQEICDAMKLHCSKHGDDFRSHWRYGMLLWHCMNDFTAAEKEFRIMVNCTAPSEPTCEAFIDCALFFQALALGEPGHNTGAVKRNKQAISMAEKTFMRALNTPNGHNNGLCLARVSLFYYHEKIDRVKAAQYQANAVHADPSMAEFLAKRRAHDQDDFME
jgi:tetratricopeptide (TPR) repeat protein